MNIITTNELGDIRIVDTYDNNSGGLILALDELDEVLCLDVDCLDCRIRTLCDTSGNGSLIVSAILTTEFPTLFNDYPEYFI